MENSAQCPRCGHKTKVELFADAHRLVHEARIIKFEKLKTHIALATAESRTPSDTDNWTVALDMVNELINSCPDCSKVPCQCTNGLAPEQLLREGP